MGQISTWHVLRVQTQHFSVYEPQKPFQFQLIYYVSVKLWSAIVSTYMSVTSAGNEVTSTLLTSLPRHSTDLESSRTQQEQASIPVKALQLARTESFAVESCTKVYTILVKNPTTHISLLKNIFFRKNRAKKIRKKFGKIISSQIKSDGSKLR